MPSIPKGRSGSAAETLKMNRCQPESCSSTSRRVRTEQVPVGELYLHPTYEVMLGGSPKRHEALARIISALNPLGLLPLVVVAQQPGETKPRRVILGAEQLRALQAEHIRRVRVVVMLFDDDSSEELTMAVLIRGRAETFWEKSVLVSVLLPIAREHAKQAQREAGGARTPKSESPTDQKPKKRNKGSRGTVAELVHCRTDWVPLLYELHALARHQRASDPANTDVARALSNPHADLAEVHERFLGRTETVPESSSSENRAGSRAKPSKKKTSERSRKMAAGKPSAGTTSHGADKTADGEPLVDRVGSQLEGLARSLKDLSKLLREKSRGAVVELKFAHLSGSAATVRRRLDRIFKS